MEDGGASISKRVKMVVKEGLFCVANSANAMCPCLFVFVLCILGAQLLFPYITNLLKTFINGLLACRDDPKTRTLLYLLTELFSFVVLS